MFLDPFLQSSGSATVYFMFRMKQLNSKVTVVYGNSSVHLKTQGLKPDDGKEVTRNLHCMDLAVSSSLEQFV